MGQKIFFCPNKQPYTFSKKTDFPRCILSQNARVILHLPSTVTRFLLRIIRANNAFDYDFRTRTFIHRAAALKSHIRRYIDEGNDV